MYDQKLSQIALNEDFCVQIEVKKYWILPTRK